MIHNRALRHWLRQHERNGRQWLQYGVKNMLIVIKTLFFIGSLLNPLFCSPRNLITTIANELKAFTKYNHAGTMKYACVCSNIRAFCSTRAVEGGRAWGVSSIRRQIDIQSAKDLSAFVFHSVVDSLISRGLTIRSTSERWRRCLAICETRSLKF